MECRINFLTHLAFQLLWMGLACTGLPPITLCIANHRCNTFYSFLMALQSYRLLWMFFLGILLLIFGLALLIGCGRAAFRKQQPISE